MTDVTLRFGHWPKEVSTGETVFAELISLAINRHVRIIGDQNTKADIQIESVYGRNAIPGLQARTYRFLASHTKSGIDFSKSKYSPNQQPSK